MSLPTTSRAWSVRDIHSDFDGLVLKENVPLPKLGEHDVLIQIEAVSLNYRDLAIPRVSRHTNPRRHLQANSFTRDSTRFP